jgi:hypothetical protein
LEAAMAENLRLPLEEWDRLIGRHLHLIEAGAEICESHAKQLFGLPDFETRAMDKLLLVEKLLNNALVRIAKARQEMDRKQRVG